MAGPWVFPKDNQAYLQELELQKGQLLECQLYKGDLMKRRWRLIHLRVRMLNKG